MRSVLALLACLACAIGSGELRAQQLTVGDFHDGSILSQPFSGLVRAPDGALYGATASGGPNYDGTIYRVTSDGGTSAVPVPEVLYTFENGLDGASPAGLTIGPDGFIYGTTVIGGVGRRQGLAFRLQPPTAGQASWTKTNLYYFKGGLEGSNPQGNLVADSAGNLYGVMTSGGAYDAGTVFRLRPPINPHGTWAFQVMHAFGGIDGCDPSSPLTIGPDSLVYGVATHCGTQDNGVAFSLQANPTVPGQWIYRVVHDFHKSTDGVAPVGGLTLGPDGNLYGLAQEGGVYGRGCLYVLIAPSLGHKAWHETVLYSLQAGLTLQPQYAAPGFTASATIVLPLTTGRKGANLTLLELARIPGLIRWTERSRVAASLASFSGRGSYGAPVLGNDGALYGTIFSSIGSGHGHGGLFRLASPP